MDILYPCCAGLDIHKDTVVACVRRLAAGHAVVIADLKPPSEPLPDGASYLPLDITDAAACVHVLAEAAGAAGLAVLVHSAAITAVARPVEQIPPAEWRQLLEVNVTGAFLVARAAIPHLRRTRGLDSVDIPSQFHSNWMDNSKAKDLLDWQPEYDLEMLIDQAWTYERSRNDPRVVWYPG